jgi:hypothetical protein
VLIPMVPRGLATPPSPRHEPWMPDLWAQDPHRCSEDDEEAQCEAGSEDLAWGRRGRSHDSLASWLPEGSSITQGDHVTGRDTKIWGSRTRTHGMCSTLGNFRVGTKAWDVCTQTSQPRTLHCPRCLGPGLCTRSCGHGPAHTMQDPTSHGSHSNF